MLYLIIIICITIVILSILFLIYKIKTSCFHQWNRVDTEYMWDENIPNDMCNPKNCSHRWEILQCTKCGEIKTVKIV